MNVRAVAGVALVAWAAAGCGSTHTNAVGTSTAPSPSPCHSGLNPSPSPSPTAFETAGFKAVISQGQTLQRQFTVNPQQHTFAVQTLWDQGDIELSLTSPSGRVYDRTTLDPAAHHHVQVNAESFAIDRPEPGQWTVQLFGALVNGSGESVSIGITQIPLSDLGPITYVVAEPDRG